MWIGVRRSVSYPQQAVIIARLLLVRPWFRSQDDVALLHLTSCSHAPVHGADAVAYYKAARPRDQEEAHAEGHQPWEDDLYRTNTVHISTKEFHGLQHHGVTGDVSVPWSTPQVGDSGECGLVSQMGHYMLYLT